MTPQEHNLGEWRIQPDLNRLESAQGVIKSLDSKAMEVLVMLLEANGDVVSQDELLDGVWKDRVVESGVVHQKIRTIRAALNDDAKNPTYIETIHKRGYRVIIHNSTENNSSTKHSRLPDGSTVSQQNVPKPNRSWRGTALGMVALLIFCAGAWWAVRPSLDKTPSPRKSSMADWSGFEPRKVAVLPLKDFSPGQDLGWLADGVASELRRQIGMWKNFKVVPDTQSREWKAMDAARGSTIYIDGSVQGVANQITVQLEVVRADTNESLWRREFPAQATTARDLQKDVATEIARFFGESAGGIIGPSNPDAYPIFLRYLQHRHYGDLEKDRHWLKRVVESDPGWAQGWTELAFATVRIAGVMHQTDIDEEIQEYLDHATGQTPGSWSWMTQWYLLYWQGELDVGLKKLRETNNAGSLARFNMSAGLHDTSAKYFKRVTEDLPFHLISWEFVAVNYINMGQYKLAVPIADRIKELQLPGQLVGFFGPAIAYPRAGEMQKGYEISALYAKAVQGGEHGPVWTQFVETFRHSLDFELAIAEKNSARAEQQIQWMIDNKEAGFAGTMLLRLGDERAESVLATFSQPPLQHKRWIWPYAKQHLTPELQNHPLIKNVDDTLGFTTAFRHRLCKLANDLSYLAEPMCDLSRYPPNDT